MPDPPTPATSTPVILLTGFEPFGSVAVNPSQLLAERLDARHLGPVRIVSRVLPVVFGDDAAIVRREIERLDPVAVFSLGIAAGSERLRVETQARNFRQSPAGRVPIEQGAPAAISSTVPVQAIEAAIRATGVPVRLSDDAGDYLCNHVLFTTLRLAASRTGHHPLAGFLHLPHAAEHAPPDTPALPLADLERAVLAALETIGRSVTMPNAIG